LQDQCRWKENLILYNFSRNREFLIRTFPTSNLARNVWVGEINAEKEIFFITAGVEKPQYKRRVTGLKNRGVETLRNPEHSKEKQRRRHQQEQREQRQKY